MKNLFDKLNNLMMFEVDGAGGTGQEDKNDPDNKKIDIDYGKIEQIIDGRLKGITKSVLKEQYDAKGISKEDLDTAINNFLEKKNLEKIEKENKLNKIKSENDILKNKIKSIEFNDELKKIGNEVGLDISKFDYAKKLINEEKNYFKEDGTIDNETLKKDLEKVLKDLPLLKKNGNMSQSFGHLPDQHRNDDKDLYNVIMKSLGYEK